MKIKLPCVQCSNKVEVEINRGSTYKIKCNENHESTVNLRNQDYEILFDLGALALIDNYTRESVSSFAVSVERFHEFCIKVMLLNNGVSWEGIGDTWKLVSNQSERQLGAFYFLYLSTFNERPEEIKSKWVTFRNKITHKGEIPSYKEAREYGEYIFDYIKRITLKLRENCYGSFTEVFYKNILEFSTDNQTKMLVTAESMLMPMVEGADSMFEPMVIYMVKEYEKIEFSSQLDQIKNNRLYSK
ncbi:hypothetical protein V7068_14790 [Bacillus sp. JJ634]